METVTAIIAVFAGLNLEFKKGRHVIILGETGKLCNQLSCGMKTPLEGRYYCSVTQELERLPSSEC